MVILNVLSSNLSITVYGYIDRSIAGVQLVKMIAPGQRIVKDFVVLTVKDRSSHQKGVC